MKGTILNIQKFCTKDGPGIRTTVFLKGCPLRCLWCHNPESQSPERENMEDPFEIAGYEISVEEVIKEVLKDKAFYENSGGGVTLSGGEPFYQSAFCLELLEQAKENGLHVCVETCGFAGTSILEQTAEFVDLYLFDYKETNAWKHKKFTGEDNRKILENLKYLDKIGKKMILRCPIIPGYNDRKEHLRGIADIAGFLKNLVEVEIEPYHTLGAEKYRRLGRRYDLSEVRSPEEETISMWIDEIQKHTTVKIERA